MPDNWNFVVMILFWWNCFRFHIILILQDIHFYECFIFLAQVNYWSKREKITNIGSKKNVMASSIKYHRLKLLLDLNLIQQNVPAFVKSLINVFLLLSCVLKSLQIVFFQPFPWLNLPFSFSLGNIGRNVLIRVNPRIWYFFSY